MRLLQVNIRRYNTVCGPGACESQEAAKGRLQNWELQKAPDPELVEVKTFQSIACLVKTFTVFSRHHGVFWDTHQSHLKGSV